MSAPAAVLARSRQPLYLQLAAEFRGMIEAGTWPVDGQIPPLEALMARYEVSRMTVRNALGELEAEGLVRRGRGKGTFVERRMPGVAELELPSTWEEAVALSDLLGTHAIVTSDTEVQTLPDMGMVCTAAPAPSYRYLCRLHSRDGVPYCYSEVYVAAQLYRRYPDRFEAHAAASVIARIPRLVVSESRQKLSIIQAGFRSADALRLEVGHAVAEVRRHACARGEIIYYARLEFPPRFVKLELDLLARPSREGQAARPAGR
ncbi:GntR family transcriptional regulator [Verticiella sediminum]|uniref:GntR family transcriptional regulator n=1 Tax=Verticiella sediminum TaxID=1247510 RepID=A0A556AIT1_9BURK|nr:GntR family transcriptional regulator [Verticiella sediminum]TSH92814.1 GntR family transcriptional regulator [Verticiella sediminum]